MRVYFTLLSEAACMRVDQRDVTIHSNCGTRYGTLRATSVWKMPVLDGELVPAAGRQSNLQAKFSKTLDRCLTQCYLSCAHVLSSFHEQLPSAAQLQAPPAFERTSWGHNCRAACWLGEKCRAFQVCSAYYVLHSTWRQDWLECMEFLQSNRLSQLAVHQGKQNATRRKYVDMSSSLRVIQNAAQMKYMGLAELCDCHSSAPVGRLQLVPFAKQHASATR